MYRLSLISFLYLVMAGADGWVIKIAGHEVGNNYGDTFRFRDGVNAVSYGQCKEFGARFSNFFYERKLSHYRRGNR